MTAGWAMSIPILATLIRVLWVIIEYPYVRRYKIKPAGNWDKHSAQLWDGANAVEVVGMVLGFTNIGRIHTGSYFIASFGLAFLCVGITIRWAAIYTLGKFFTGTVLIKEDHRLIQNGLYRYVRHPAYTGTLLAHLGLGLSFSNWFSIGLSILPLSLAAFYRMHVEERALRDAFGEKYIQYSAGTKRLIPKLY
jgi:protein-S-isoprenylcysteine O-methyltransferase Ste14